MASQAQASTTPVAEIPLRPRFGRGWAVALALAAALTVGLLAALAASFAFGVGIWGVNVPFVWGFDLTNYAWWIGVANGASLFAAALVLRRHNLRTAVNRFAEGTALFAVICAGLFPVIHLGRPELFYWVVPYPATYQVWPQFRSTLTWDLWGIAAHGIVTTLLWYTGLIPDLATLRDRARRPAAKRAYGVLALGWRGSVRHWAHHQAAYRLVAILVLPLILVMQGTVALEFALTLAPDWHEGRLPVHFVATGLAQGLATVLMVAALLRRGLGLERFIDDRDVDLLGRLVLGSALVAIFLYADELTAALFSPEAQRAATFNRLFGDDARIYWGALACSVAVPQLLWWRAARRSLRAAVGVGLAVNLGVWLDRYSTVVAGLGRDHLPATWGRTYAPTWPEWGLLFGTIGLFAALLLLFARYLPAVSMFETRHDEHGERT